MQDFGEAFTPRRACKAHQSHDLTSAARCMLGHAGIERVLAFLNADPIPTRTAVVADVPVRAGAARAGLATLCGAAAS